MKGVNKLKNRITKIRKISGKNQDEFAAIMGISKNYVSLIENGKKTPSDRLIADICREFNINEEWLRTGEGEMQKPVDTDYQIISTLIGEKDPKAKQAIIDYWKLSEQDKELFWNFINRFIIGKSTDSLDKSDDLQLIPDNPNEFEKKFAIDTNNENIS